MHESNQTLKLISVSAVRLPCGHQRPAHYIIACFKYYIKQVAHRYTLCTYILTIMDSCAAFAYLTSSPILGTD